MAEVNDALIETEEETDKLVDTFKSDFDKALAHVKDFDSQYAKFLENMRKNTNTLVQALNNLIKGFAELDGRAANVISTSNDRIAAAEVELESQSDGSGTPKTPSVKYYYLGNHKLSSDETQAKKVAKSLTKGYLSDPTPYITEYPSGTYYLFEDGYLGRNEGEAGARGGFVRRFNTGGYTGD